MTEVKKRGRPRSDAPKQLVSIRLDGDVLAYWRNTGKGWHGRVNAALRDAAGLEVKG